jgi:hypothetical protein
VIGDLIASHPPATRQPAMQADDAAHHAPAADLAGVIDNLITDARQMEDQRDAALARVAYLEKTVEKMTPIYQQAMIKNIHDKWDGKSDSARLTCVDVFPVDEI